MQQLLQCSSVESCILFAKQSGSLFSAGPSQKRCPPRSRPPHTKLEARGISTPELNHSDLEHTEVCAAVCGRHLRRGRDRRGSSPGHGSFLLHSHFNFRSAETEANSDRYDRQCNSTHKTNSDEAYFVHEQGHETGAPGGWSPEVSSAASPKHRCYEVPAMDYSQINKTQWQPDVP